MAITTSAKKAERASRRRRVFNVRRKGALKDATKDVKKTIDSGNSADAEKLLPAAFKAIDKAMKRGLIKKNTAARKKSRLVKAIRAAGK
jgi:small subunit ribosomal protein S20